MTVPAGSETKLWAIAPLLPACETLAPLPTPIKVMRYFPAIGVVNEPLETVDH
jgi:hypothetical protein